MGAAPFKEPTLCLTPSALTFSAINEDNLYTKKGGVLRPKGLNYNAPLWAKENIWCSISMSSIKNTLDSNLQILVCKKSPREELKKNTDCRALSYSVSYSSSTFQ